MTSKGQRYTGQGRGFLGIRWREWDSRSGGWAGWRPCSCDLVERCFNGLHRGRSESDTVSGQGCNPCALFPVL